MEGAAEARWLQVLPSISHCDTQSCDLQICDLISLHNQAILSPPEEIFLFLTPVPKHTYPDQDIKKKFYIGEIRT